MRMYGYFMFIHETSLRGMLDGFAARDPNKRDPGKIFRDDFSSE
jgi:hypothetical protein